jgi:hypothetical protein
MNQMFIPEIGTEFKLEAPWKFNLYPEYRNETLAKKLGFPKFMVFIKYSRDYFWIDQEAHNAFEQAYETYQKEQVVNGITHEWYEKHHCSFDYTEDPLWKKLNNAYHIKRAELETLYKDTIHCQSVLEVIFSEGTILKVDRIYIRKGKDMSNFSSLTFYVKSGPSKGARFWVKLNEVNQIMFSLI